MAESFRCPFEVRGERDDTIIDVKLPAQRKRRLAAIKKALLNFDENLKSPGIRFSLPALNDCESLEELRDRTLSFQAEVLACELSHRLYPFLPYQLKGTHVRRPEAGTLEGFYRLEIAYQLTTIIYDMTGRFIQSEADIADWIFETIRKGRENLVEEPKLMVLQDDIPLASIGVGGIEFAHERDETITKRNRNSFHLVKSPLYPENTARHDKNVMIAVSREADFTSVASSVRADLRRRNARALRENGITLEDLPDDKQPGGVWIPKELAKRDN